MIIYRVIFSNVGHTQFEHMISDTPQIIGRSTKADVVLSEDSVSRRHAKLTVVGNDLHIEDLGSSNGVIVNGERVRESLLSANDLVQIGCYSIRVELLDANAQRKLTRRTEIEYNEVAPIHEKLVEADQSSVSFLYRVSQCLCTKRQFNPLVEGVLDAIMDNIPGERGYVIARRDSKEELKLMASRVRQRRDTDPPVSHTLIDHVMQSRASVMTTDASQDERFEGSASIAEYQIKAVICVPLTGHSESYGVIYIDSRTVPVPLTQKHLQLLSIVGQIVGAGIENIILNEKQIRQERLAGIGETISGTSHDMRNILMGIAGGTEMIEYACQEEKWKLVKDGLRILKQSSERFKTLSESLLTYSRVSELQLKVTDPDKLINEVLGTVSAEAQKRAIDVQFSSRQPGNIIMDGQQMYRVLLNLVRNAMDAMEGTEGRLEIESGNDEGTAYIRVRDSGKGIAPEHLARIGEPFFTTKEDKGTGLGLAICFRIMEQHRGRIDVESTPQQGTTFTLKFPPDNTMTRHDHMVL